jgi:hypothetical protein
MTGALTAGRYLWRPGGDSVAGIRRQRHPCPKINPKPQNLRQKSHSWGLAAPNKCLSTGITASFNDNGINGIVAFVAQDCRRERLTFDWK